MIASDGVAATSSGIGSCQSANALSSADFSARGSSPPLSRLSHAGPPVHLAAGEPRDAEERPAPE